MMDNQDPNVAFDGEAEIDKLLMMHMSKHNHDEEVHSEELSKISPALSYQAHEMEPPRSRGESCKKKRPPRTRVMNLAMETID